MSETRLACQTHETKDAKPLSSAQLRIGVDFGGVMSKHDHKADIRTGHFSTEIDVPDALETLTLWKQKGYVLILVSFCGNKRAEETKKSIESKCPGLFDELVFVKKREDKKRITADRKLDVMIDDTLTILQDIVDNKAIARSCLWFVGDPNMSKDQKEAKIVAKYAYNQGIVRMDSWKVMSKWLLNLKS